METKLLELRELIAFLVNFLVPKVFVFDVVVVEHLHGLLSQLLHFQPLLHQLLVLLADEIAVLILPLREMLF